MQVTGAKGAGREVEHVEHRTREGGIEGRPSWTPTRLAQHVQGRTAHMSMTSMHGVGMSRSVLTPTPLPRAGEGRPAPCSRPSHGRRAGGRAGVLSALKAQHDGDDARSTASDDGCRQKGCGVSVHSVSREGDGKGTSAQC